jgi:carbohydrate-selective porin OprB
LELNGVTFQGGFTTDVFGIVTGGDSQATYYAGLMDFGATADLEKILGWRGGSFQTTWLWISGNGPESPLSGQYLPLSGIAGYPTLRMLELWFEQDLWESKASLRLGQITADSEFLAADRFRQHPERRTRKPDGNARRAARRFTGRLVGDAPRGVPGECFCAGRKPLWLRLQP